MVKMCCNGDMRRKRFSQVAEVTIDEINALVHENYSLDRYLAKYRDDDGDLCSLTALTLSDALDLSVRNGSMLRLEVISVFPAELQAELLRGPGGQEGAVLQLQTSSQRSGAEEAAQQEEEEDSCWTRCSPDVLSYAIHTPAMNSPRALDAWPAEPSAALLSPAQPSVPPGGFYGTADAIPADALEPFATAPTEPSSCRSPLEDGLRSGGLGEDICEQPRQEEPSSSSSPLSTNLSPTTEQVGGLTMWDKVFIILAAFDVDDDGHLNLEESNELQKAAWDGQMEPDTYSALCLELGVNAAVGLGPEELSKMYARYDNLDRDFAVSLVRLQSGSTCAARRGQCPGQADVGIACNEEAPPATSGFRPCHLLPLLALPLVVRAPWVGLPVAALVARRRWC